MGRRIEVYRRKDDGKELMGEARVEDGKLVVTGELNKFLFENGGLCKNGEIMLYPEFTTKEEPEKFIKILFLKLMRGTRVFAVARQE